MDFKQFVKDRDEALLSLDVEKLKAYAAKYNAKLAEPGSDLFWASIHKARTAANGIPEDAKQLSRDWLKERGLSSMD